MTEFKAQQTVVESKSGKQYLVVRDGTYNLDGHTVVGCRALNPDGTTRGAFQAIRTANIKVVR